MPAARAWKMSGHPRTLSIVVTEMNSSGLKALWSPSVSPKALYPFGRVLGEQTGDLVASTGRVPLRVCVIVGLLCCCTGHFSHQGKEPSILTALKTYTNSETLSKDGVTLVLYLPCGNKVCLSSNRYVNILLWLKKKKKKTLLFSILFILTWFMIF